MPPKKKSDARGGAPKPGTKQAKAAAERTAESAKTQQPADEQKKPSVKQVIGGSSWTGKLPVNMLSEHCQKHKWEKPEYTMVRGPSCTRSYCLCCDSSHTNRLFQCRTKSETALSPPSYCDELIRRRKKRSRFLPCDCPPHSSSLLR